MLENNTVILKVIVGSIAHGLNTPESDIDYRGVYVTPTTEILSLGHKYKGSHWLEGEKDDQTAWEIGHFLHLATKCNPTILEVFKAPRIPESDGIDLESYPMKVMGAFGEELRDLFPYVWNPHDCFNAFVGYGMNQRKKFLDKKDERGPKYAVAYIRTLYNLIDLLKTGTFSLEVIDPSIKEILLEMKEDRWSDGKVIDLANTLTKEAKRELDKCTHKPNIDKVNDFLLRIRKEFWR